MPISEMQARWYAQLMAGKSKLPSRHVMQRDIRKKREEMKKRYYDSPRHTVQVDYLPYMDELACQFGVKPSMVKLFLTDQKLWKALAFGPCVAYQYRLTGPHPWSGAREAVLDVEERVQAGLPGRVSNDKQVQKSSLFSVSTLLSLAVVGMAFVYKNQVIASVMAFINNYWITSKRFNLNK